MELLVCVFLLMHAHRAARADNIPIVIKLISEYKVDEKTHDVHTAESLMHIACQNFSKLRFYLVHHYPHLMRKRDMQGTLPLHIACRNNDIQFVSWLFQNILTLEEREGSELTPVEGTLKRAKSHSELISTFISIPPNRSLNCVPMSPVDLTSPVTSRIPTRFHSIDTENFTREDYDGTPGSDSDTLSPLSTNIHDRGLHMSFDSTRAFSVSVSSGSRSGSSERFIKSSLSDSLEDTVDFHSCGPGLNKEDKGANSEPSTSDIPIPQGNGHVKKAIEVENSIPVSKSEQKLALELDDLVSPHSLTIGEQVDMKPFTVDVDGDSIFHILARKGYVEILEVIVKVATFLKHQVDLSILSLREGFFARLPIEEALCVKSSECVTLLIRLSMVAGHMPVLLQDPHLLRCAVLTNDINLVRILIENGFHRGLKPAISLAIISEFDDILRVLLFWQTQVVNSIEFSRVKVMNGRKMRILDNGGIKWEEIQLEGIQHQWLIDSCNAVISVSKLLTLSRIAADITEYDFQFFKKLGSDCLQYFDNLKLTTWPNQLQFSLAPITELNVSENQLTSIPRELFQMPSLHELRLSHNKLFELPTSDVLTEDIYTSSLVKLDLDWNMLKSLPEDMFRGLAHSLKELSAQNNQLTTLPPGLWVMPRLKRIRLACNKLERLHSLSIPSYFNDIAISKLISSSFTASKNNELVCTSRSRDSNEMLQYTQYLKKLAMFYHTICKTKCPKGVYDPATTYQEVISIHRARYQNFNHSDSSSSMPRSQSTRVLSLFEDDALESALECCMDIEVLDLSYNNFKELPWDLACITPNVKKLDLRNNPIQQLDIVHDIPRNTNSLILMHNKMTSLNKDRSLQLPCGNPLRLLCVQDSSEWEDGYCQHCNHPTLDKLSNLILENNSLSYFPIADTPRVESNYTASEIAGYEVVYCEPYYSELSILSLAHNDFTAVPKSLHRLTHLSSLNLSHNKITELPLEMGLMNSMNLILLKLDGLFLRNVPETLLDNHTPKKLLNHLKALKQK